MKNNIQSVLGYKSLIRLILLFCITIPAHLCSMLEPQPQQEQKTMLKIRGSDDVIIEVELDIANESITINNMLEDLGGYKPELIIPIELFSSFIIQGSFNIIKVFMPSDKSADKLKEDPLNKEYPLDTMVLILNCIEYLDCPTKIKKAFSKKIYPLCKKIPFEELISQVKDLNSNLIPEIFGDIIINRLKLLLIGWSIGQENRKIDSSIGYSNTAFSPNNKMIAGSTPGGEFTIETLNNGQIIAKHTIDIKSYESATFINDKQLAIMKDQNIFLYDVNSEGAMSEKPSQTLIIPNFMSPESFSNPYNGRYEIKVSPNKKLLISSHANNCFLWHIDENGIIKSDPDHLMKNEFVATSVVFYEDAIAIISTKDRDSLPHLQVFNTDGTLNFSFELSSDTYPSDFYSHDKKFIAKSEGEIFIYDFNDKNNVTHKKIYSTHAKLGPIKAILDDNAIFVGILAETNTDNVLFLDMNNINNDAKKITVDWITSYPFFISQDNSIIAFFRHRFPNLVYILINDEEKSVLDSIKKLGLYQLLLIDQLIDGVTGLPQLDASSDIIKLLKSLDLITEQKKTVVNAAALKHVKSKPEIPKTENPTQTAALLKLRERKKDDSPDSPASKLASPEPPIKNKPMAEYLPPDKNDSSNDSGFTGLVKSILRSFGSIVESVISFFQAGISRIFNIRFE